MNGEKIISVHIPKTAGTSFRNTLIEAYGRERIWPFYYPDKSRVSYKIPSRVNVVHGHITIDDRRKLIEANQDWENAKLISWVRNPVDRFISNYFYMRGIIEAQLNHFKETPDLKNRMVCTLEDFIRRPNERNETNRYIDPDDLKNNRFMFIGQVEKYDEDLRRAAFVLGLNTYTTFKHNTTKGKENVDLDTRNQISSLLADEIALYEQITAWEDERVNKMVGSISEYSPNVSLKKELNLRNRIITKVISALEKI